MIPSAAGLWILHSKLSEKTSIHLVPHNTHKGQTLFLTASQKKGLAPSRKAF